MRGEEELNGMLSGLARTGGRFVRRALITVIGPYLPVIFVFLAFAVILILLVGAVYSAFPGD
ncbi:MAG: peptidase M23, partial [Desulfofundulus sp.]